MATLEDAAEELVVRLRGLDSEIEESAGKLEELRGRMETAKDDVEQEWTAFSEAATSFLDKIREEQEQLHGQAEETSGAVVDAHREVAESGGAARQDIAEGRAQMEALEQHAAGLEPGVESLAAEVGEAPARALAERARELEQELEKLVAEARDFLQDEVVAAAQETADQVRQVCETLRDSLAEAAAEGFRQAYQDWESTVDGLEDYVVGQGYEASHQHARDVVDYALGECDTACSRQLDELRPLVEVLAAQLKEAASGIEQSAERLVSQAGTELVAELDRTCSSAAAAIAALDEVKRELAQYSFVEV